jgi:hypothetical protein
MAKATRYESGKEMTEKLDGKKTYIGIAFGIIYSVLIYFKVAVSNDLLWTAIAGWTGVSARVAITKK